MYNVAVATSDSDSFCKWVTLYNHAPDTYTMSIMHTCTQTVQSTVHDISQVWKSPGILFPSSIQEVLTHYYWKSQENPGMEKKSNKDAYMCTLQKCNMYIHLHLHCTCRSVINNDNNNNNNKDLYCAHIHPAGCSRRIVHFTHNMYSTLHVHDNSVCMYTEYYTAFSVLRCCANCNCLK